MSSVFSGTSFALRRSADDDDGQADLSRLTNVLKVVAEVNEHCWRGENCDLCEGVREGVGQFAVHAQTHADVLERRVSLSHRIIYTYIGIVADICYRRALCCIARLRP